MITTLDEFVNKDELTPEYFIKRVPFFKDFENLSGGKEITFKHFKNFYNEAVIRHQGGDNLHKPMTIPYLSVETNFNMFYYELRDFEREEQDKRRPIINKQYYFTYWTSIHVTNPKEIETEDDIVRNLVTIMLTKIIENDLKFQDNFIVKDGDEIPKEQIDSMVNKINKNLFRIEDTLEKMYVSYF